MMFDEDSFLDTGVQGESSTQFKVLPTEANPYQAIIKPGSVKARKTQGKQDPSKTYFWLDMDLELQLPPQVAADMKRDTTNVRYSVGLDLTEQGALDMSESANINLGRLRKATGQNDGSKSWKPRDLEGKMLKVHIKHRKVNEDTYNEVDKLEANVI